MPGANAPQSGIVPGSPAMIAVGRPRRQAVDAVRVRVLELAGPFDRVGLARGT